MSGFITKHTCQDGDVGLVLFEGRYGGIMFLVDEFPDEGIERGVYWGLYPEYGVRGL